MKNLYSFSKDAWHIKLCKWLYNIDVEKTFKNFCPYFWVMFLTFLILPVVVLGKLCGNLAAKFYAYNTKRKEVNYQKRKEKFLEYCKQTLTAEAAYRLYNSPDWPSFSHLLSNEKWNEIYMLHSEHRDITPYKIPKFKINFDLFFIIFLFLVLIGCIIGLLLNINWSVLTWKAFKETAIWTINAIALVVGFFNIIKYLFFHRDYLG